MSSSTGNRSGGELVRKEGAGVSGQKRKRRMGEWRRKGSDVSGG